MQLSPLSVQNTADLAQSAKNLNQQNDANVFEALILRESSAYGVDPQTALKIARCESSLRQWQDDGSGEVLRGHKNPADVGLFQINEKYHLAQSESLELDIYSAQGNVEYAMSLIKRDGLRHWHWSKPCWGK